MAFIKVDRTIFDTDIFDHPLVFRLYMLILKEAHYGDGYTINGIKLGRGQWLRSYRKLRDDLEYKDGRGYKKPSVSTIKRAINRLVEYGLITTKEPDSGTDSGTLFTVVETQEYQGVSETENQIAERIEVHSRNTRETLAEHSQNEKEEEKKEEEKKDNNNNRRKRPVYADDSPYIKMADYFLQKIHEWYPEYKRKSDAQKWADDFRKLHELDKKSKQAIKAVIDWATSHHFWQSNILSPDKLRKQFQRLYAQMKSEESGKVTRFPKHQGGDSDAKSWDKYDGDKKENRPNSESITGGQVGWIKPKRRRRA
jgi:hypothetical protein